MAPQVGLEPTTLRLTAECSAIELLRSVGLFDVHNIISQSALKTSGWNILEVFVIGGFRLLAMLSCFLFVAMAWVDNQSFPMPTPEPSKPPKVKRQVVEETIHGHAISDPYRWLEISDSPDTEDYVRQELAYTRSILDPLAGREQIERRLRQLISIGNLTAPQVGGNYYFYTRRSGTQNQPVLLVREGVHGKDRTLVDVNTFTADGTVALDWYFPSQDGKYVAYGTSSSGSEESTLHLIESATQKRLAETIDRTRFASIAWKKDSSGFFYTKHPKEGEVPAGEEVYHVKVFYHSIGSDPEKDSLIFDPLTLGKNHTPQDIPQVALPDDDDRWLLITVFEGWAKSELYLQDLQAGTPPVEITSGKNFLYSAEVFNSKLYIVSNEAASRYRVFGVEATNPKRDNWKEIIPESDAVLQNVSVFGGKLLAQYEKNASSLLKQFDLEGKIIGDVQFPTLGTVPAIGGRWDHKEAFVGFQSFTVPPSVYQVDLESRKASLWDTVEASGIDPSKYEVNQVWFNSKDGTRVPMFVFHKKSFVFDGKSPALLTGYGGFNVSLTPSFVGGRFLWLEHGGVFAVANLRGGAEFGEDWHRAGMLQKKQNVFDDFIAAAQYLIAAKYTDKDHLAIQGGSNGGLLMGAMITQRPDLFRAVVCQVPLLDMLRYQNFRIAKLWIPEYGSAGDATQFEWLYAYSPYQHVKAGTEYPAIMFMTADTDTRVDPMHAKKMAALMQAEAANGQSRERPILLRIEPKAGHGAGKPVTKQIEEGVDIYSFLFWQLGMTE
jgi:prolyl oligopeptidase